MKKSILAGGVAVIAVFAGVVYFAGREDADRAASKAAGASSASDASPAPGAPQESAPGGAAVPGVAVSAAQKAAADPRLAALTVSPDNGLIEFVVGTNGKVIKEIDKDPASRGFGKPLREYTYRGDQVVGLVSHKYLGDQVQTTRIAVAYKPDGTIDQYQEATSYDFGKTGKPQG